MLFEKILICTDFSTPSKLLFNCVPELINLGLKEVIIIHVVDIKSAGGNVEIFQKNDEDKLNEIKIQLEEMELKVSIKVPVGFPVEEIVKTGQEENVSLILMASHGAGIIKSLFLGSTTFDTIRISTIPILIEKFKDIESEKCEAYCAEKFKKIVIPIDFSESSYKVAEEIKKAGKVIEEIIFISVIEKSKSVDELEKSKKEAEENLNLLKEDFVSSGYRVKTHIKEGTASKNIMETAEKERASLIALSKHGAGTVKGILIGSTADAIARQSKIPVLLFPYE